MACTAKWKNARCNANTSLSSLSRAVRHLFRQSFEINVHKTESFVDDNEERERSRLRRLRKLRRGVTTVRVTYMQSGGMVDPNGCLCQFSRSLTFNFTT